FALNPIVTMQHCYHLPPAGKSLWRKSARADRGGLGIKAKTYYPTLPDGWPAEKDWVPDVAFSLVQSRLLNGKSIGFLPVKVHTPSGEEIARNGWQNVSLVIDEWILLEYACVFLPAQQNALVEQVSKSQVASPALLKSLGLAVPDGLSQIIPYCPLETLETSICKAIEGIDVMNLAERS